MSAGRRPFFGSAQAVAMGGLMGAFLTGPLFPFAILVLALILTPVWLVICLPLYALVPRRSVLWHPALCLPLGALSGAALGFGLFALSWAPGGVERPLSPWMAFLIADAAIMGMVACLVAIYNAPIYLDSER